MDKTVQMAVCYLSISKLPSSISECMKSQKLNQMRTMLASLGIPVREVYVDQDFEQTPTDKPGLKSMIARLLNKEFDIFVIDSIYDLGDNFLECIKTLQHLVEHDIRVICLDNHIDSAFDASLC